MTRKTLLIALAATVALASCKPKTIVAGGPDDSPDSGTNVAASGPVALPPSITATKTYRCKDNSLVYIDWMSDNTARARRSKDEVGTTIATGSSELTGTATGSTITYKGQTCKA
jgi:hypothetical protein